MNIVTITPAMASSMLENNDSNRPIRNHHVQWFLELMKRGEYLPEVSPILLSRHDRRLLNGQHRLTAAVMLAKPVRMWIEEVDPKVMAYVDGDALARRLGERCRFQGIGPADNFIASLLTVAAKLRKNIRKLTAIQAEQLYTDWSSEIDWCVPFTKSAAKGLTRCAVWAAIVEARRACPETAETFAEGLKDLGSGGVVGKFRVYLLTSHSYPLLDYEKTVGAFLQHSGKSGNKNIVRKTWGDEVELFGNIKD